MKQKIETYDEKHLCGEGQKKRSYETLSMTVVETVSASPILAASVITSAKVQSVGQELAPIIDLSAAEGIDTNTGKTFSHEWESGTGSSL